MPADRRSLTIGELESLRREIYDSLHSDEKASRLPFAATLWGWNFGFDFSPSGYRLHASHQQIHSQYALVPKGLDPADDAEAINGLISAYCCGDLVADFLRRYRKRTGKSFFPALLSALRANRRMDRSDDGNQSLVIYEDDQVMLFVPKAQTSQWELQLVALKPVGNILEAGTAARFSLDRALLMAMQTLEAMGAKMITVIEYAKRFDSADDDQRLFYSFLPRLPQSPGAFSEAQLRWIIGHYPEDFAAACRSHLQALSDDDGDQNR